MPEIISLSLGSHANFKSTHFWNAQDEALKVFPTDEDAASMAGTKLKVIYHELASTSQLVPRHIYVDFGENFGNTTSCFGSQAPEKSLVPSNGALSDVDSQLWEGQIADYSGHGYQPPMSTFQSELLELDMLQMETAQY